MKMLDLYVRVRVCHVGAVLVEFTHIVMESLGLAGMFACLPPVRGGAVQIPEYTVNTGQDSDNSENIY